MTVRLIYDFNGGSNGSPIVESGMTLGAGAPAYVASGAMHGALSMQCPAGTASNYMRFDLGASPATHSGSLYFKIASNAMTGTQESTIVRFCQVATTTAMAQIKFHGNGKLSINDAPNTTVINSTVTFTVGQWHRIDWRFDVSTPTTPQIIVRIFLNPETAIPDETITLNTTSAVTFGRWAVGSVGTAAASRELQIDTVRIEDGLTWIGPFNPPSSYPVVFSRYNGVSEDFMQIDGLYNGTAIVPADLELVSGTPDFDYQVITNTDIQTVLTSSPTNSTIYIQPGTYRLTAPLYPKTGQTIFGDGGDAVVIKGSVVLSSWTSNGAGQWYASGALPSAYTETNGVCEDLTNLDCRKREQVFINGEHLTRYMSLSALGTNVHGFYEDYAANRVYIATNPAGKTVEMSKLNHAILSKNGGTTANTVKLRGLTVQHCASPSQLGAIYLDGGNDWEISECNIQWNHAIGIHSANALRLNFHHNNVHHNGQLGVGSNACHNSVYEYNIVTDNNTDNYYGGDWESGGIKITHGDNVIIQNNLVTDNVGIGVWYDIDNRNGIIYNNDINDNYADAIRFEISYGCKIYGNRISGNGYGYGIGPGRGGTDKWAMISVAAINVNSSPDVEIYNNIIGANQNGIGLQMRDRGNGAYGLRDLKNAYVHHNTIYMTTGGTSGVGEGSSGLDTLAMGSVPFAPYYDIAQKNNLFDYNTYYVDSISVKRFAWSEGYRVFADFQAYGQETHGTCSVPPPPGYQIATTNDDGNWHNIGVGLFSQSTTSGKIFIGDNIGSTTDYDRHGWAKFSGVTIPVGATITSAVLKLYATGLTGVPPQMRIYAEAADNAAAPTSRTDVTTTKTRTTAFATWAPSTWTTNQWQTSPSLITVIQEIVSRGGWASGNSIQLFIQDNQAGNVSGQISYASFENNPAISANLQINYTV